MKVGTDGVLLGAWVQLPDRGPCLDVGAGSGLISLIMAQRFPKQKVIGIELDSNAAQQATENVAASPFADRVEILCADFLKFPFQENSIRAIVSNPPFFQEKLLSPNELRAQARHSAVGLTFEDLVSRSRELLVEGGSLQVILPTTVQKLFCSLCEEQGFTLLRQTEVCTVVHKSPKRALLHFIKSRYAISPCCDRLILMHEGQRTAAYSELCRDLYL